VIFDPVAGPFLEKLAEAAATGGIVFEYGALSVQPTPFPLLTALAKGLSIRGYSLMEITRIPEKLPAAKKYVYDRLADGRFHPKVARIFPFAVEKRRRVGLHIYEESCRSYWSALADDMPSTFSGQRGYEPRFLEMAPLIRVPGGLQPFSTTRCSAHVSGLPSILQVGCVGPLRHLCGYPIESS
jgi:hypothetical protein